MESTTPALGIRRARLGRSVAIVALIAGLVSANLLIQAEPAVALTCRAGYVCLYDNAGYTGLLLEVPGNHNSRVYFADNRKNRASSWSNNSDYDWCARDDLNFRPDEFLFTLLSRDDHYYVTDARNDRADYIYPC